MCFFNKCFGAVSEELIKPVHLRHLFWLSYLVSCPMLAMHSYLCLCPTLRAWAFVCSRVGVWVYRSVHAYLYKTRKLRRFPNEDQSWPSELLVRCFTFVLLHGPALHGGAHSYLEEENRNELQSTFKCQRGMVILSIYGVSRNKTWGICTGYKSKMS